MGENEVGSVLGELEKLGTAQNVKVYKRHGAKEPLFGVSFAHLNKLAKTYRGQTELARGLWASGNTDARILACMIASPDEMTSAELDRWVKEVDYTALAGYLGALTGKTTQRESKIKKWTKAREEFVRDTGYSIVSHTLKTDADALDEKLCVAIVDEIAKSIHLSPNFAKNAMNMALIAIGTYKPKLTAKAIAAAKKIGKVEVDHGETACKTPDAVAYIEKAANIKKKKKK